LNCKWVNAPSAISEANDRRNQLMTAKACGFDIPSTIITNDPQTAKDFYYSCNCNIIVKALHSHAVELGGDMYCMFSRSLSEEDLVRINDLVYAPCILQEKVQKKSEMRVTVVGDKVFAAVMKFSSESKRSEDIHRCSPNDVTLEAYRELRPVIIEKCIRFVKSLGLRYGAIDFVVDKNDNLVFLEVNPAGDWYWIEQETRLPITTAMAALIEDLA
jgi:glutathione synthase/RimK-type ligase-like ATP-grasp enzyme